MHDPLPDTSVMLAAILAELKGLRADLAISRTPLTDRQKLANLLHVIAETVGDNLFTCSDLLLRIPAPNDAAMRAAILQAVGVESPRRIGKLLKRYEGLEAGGFRIIRVGQERDGVLWQVVACLPPHTLSL